MPLFEPRTFRVLVLAAAGIAAWAAESPVKPKLQADGWLIDSDVECGNSRIIDRIGASHFALAPREDPVPIEVQKTGPISNYVVYVEIANQRAEARTLTIDILIPEWLIREKFDYFLRKTYLVRAPGNLDYWELPASHHDSLPDRMRLKIDFGPNERKILSTIPAYPYSRMRQKLAELERYSNGNARIREMGTSVQGRAILSLETGDKTKPRAVFLATMQPGEPSAWAVLAMAEAALYDPELAKFRKEYDLAFIPMTNPDGIVHGLNNVNAKGEIVMLGFEAMSRGEDRPELREAKVLWNYLLEKPPSVLLDFHFLTLPNHPIPRPYVFTPSLYTDPERRQAGISLVRRLERLTGAAEGREIAEDHPMWRNLVTYNAVKRWNTVATLYQNTGPFTSWQQARRRGVELMRVALDPEYMKR